VKKTRAARGRTKVSVVTRRARLPLVVIHARDDSKCLILGLRAGLVSDEPDDAVEEACDEDGCDVFPALVPSAAGLPPVTFRSELEAVEVAADVPVVEGAEGVDVDGVPTEGVLEGGGGAGTVGAGSFGSVGSGRGGVVTVGTVVGGGGSVVTVTVGTATVGT
jgi:hypothetical protein